MLRLLWKLKKVIFILLFISAIKFSFIDWEQFDLEQSKKLSQSELEQIRKLVKLQNENVENRRQELNKLLTIVIQVHDRSKYLRILIESLRKNVGIEKVQLIFSHDVYSEELNSLIESINFTQVFQIFYPYSIQLYPDSFPGKEPSDCPPNLEFEKAKKIACQNWQYPDLYGHYRDIKYVQIKNHWWWKMNFVFQKLLTNEYKGWVLLLEEDNYLISDAIHVLNKMIETRPTECPYCTVINIGSHKTRFDASRPAFDRLAIKRWHSKDHNIGMIFTYKTWKDIHKCSGFFCNDDDYNWDFSLLRSTLQCTVNQSFWVLQPEIPRAYHIGDCGVHTKRCKRDKTLGVIEKLFSNYQKSLFPKSLTVDHIWKAYIHAPKKNGGWADPRDRKLCIKNTM